ncbi:MAG: SDR family oxidoreductase [Colwellia sp.]|nr:SDR family oxidoreductase [Colwellia sp.]
MSKSVYLITGAGSGIGAAIATKLATTDTLLIIHTKQNKLGLQNIAFECQSLGADVICQYGDLSKQATIESLVQVLNDNCDHLNGLVCNAGYPDWRNFEALDQQGLAQSYSVIIDATFALLSQCTKLLIKSNTGKIVAVSSFLAHKFRVGGSVVPASAMAKAGLEALIKSYAAQYASQGINANIIVPGYIKKNSPEHQPLDQASLDKIINRIPAGELGLPEDVANLADFLLSSKAKYITGQSIHIDGGLLLG